jgi:DNA polymerase III delta subunit
MARVKAEVFLKQAAQVPRVAVISGSETWFRDASLAHLLAALPKDIEVEVRDGAGEIPIDPPAFFDDLRMSSLFGGERVIVLVRADAFLKEHSDPFKRFMESGGPLQRLILVGEELLPKRKGEGPKRGPLASLDDDALLVSCDALYDTPFQGQGPAWKSPLSSWVVDRARFRNKRISMEDAWLLHRLTGNNLGEIEGLLDKLALRLGKRTSISADDIEASCAGTRLVPVFALADAAASRQLPLALESSAILFERGLVESSGRITRDPQGITAAVVGALAMKLRRLGRVTELMAGGMDFDGAADAVRENPMFRDTLRRQVQACGGSSGVRLMHTGLVDLDAAMKSSSGDARALLDRFLITCCSREDG